MVSDIKEGQLGRQKWDGPGRSGLIMRSERGIISGMGATGGTLGYRGREGEWGEGGCGVGREGE